MCPLTYTKPLNHRLRDFFYDVSQGIHTRRNNNNFIFCTKIQKLNSLPRK